MTKPRWTIAKEPQEIPQQTDKPITNSLRQNAGAKLTKMEFKPPRALTTHCVRPP